MKKAQEYQALYYNRHHQDVSFVSGDQVFLHSRHLDLGVTRKLKQRWLGPFSIVGRIGNNAYRLDLGGRY